MMSSSMGRSLLLFGTPCSFADIVLKSLIDAGHDVRARLMPGDLDSLEPFNHVSRPRVSMSSSALPIAGRQQSIQEIPVYRINDHMAPVTHDLIMSFKADIAMVCCYPQRIPADLMTTTRLGGLNLHPSLLPAYRGPEPLFWMYRNGELTTGGTVHQVVEQLDAGPIIRQRQISLPIGKPGDQVWTESAEIGAELLRDVLVDPEVAIQERVPQTSATASYQSWPSSNDLVIDPHQWDAWRVFHFCRGMIPLGYSPSIWHRNRYIRVKAVNEYWDNPTHFTTSAPAQGTPIECRSGLISIEFGA
jgi:methionyl-tRNA formyltransferase